jgi:two-component system KDP operon response regulator KdpE
MGVIASEPASTTAAPRALVVNAEPGCLRGLTIVLRRAGYVVESARTGPDALSFVAGDALDVLVLDLARPDRGGVEFCAGVRRLSAVPILILSPVGAQREIVRALNAGADDHLSRPCRGRDLLDRLRGVVPASVEARVSSPLVVGELVIDLTRRRVSRRGAVLLLGVAEFELVRVLAQRRGRVVTDRQLLRSVWGDRRGEETQCLRVTGRAFAGEAGERPVAARLPDR